MQEKHDNEQYFFDDQTICHLADFCATWTKPCCVCAPMTGQAVAQRNSQTVVLDIDTRFNDLSGFQYFDITQPQWNSNRFDLILCDPPFFNVSLAALRIGIRSLSQFDVRQPMLVSYLTRRSTAFLQAFAEFNLKPTGYFPTYRSVHAVARNKVEFFSNLATEELQPLLMPN